MTRIINIFRRNFLKKVIALIAAFFMWVFVMDDQDPSINGSYTVPLAMSNVPYEFFSVCDVKTVQLDTRAARSKFVKYDANAFRVYANLEGLGEGNHQVPLQVVMPQGFELIETRPSTVNVKLDPLTERQMPAELVTKGNVASDAAIRDVRKSMEFVTIVGPKSFVEQAAKVYGTVDLADNASSFETQVSMNAVDENDNVIKRVRVVPSVITVSFDIESGLKKRIVPIIPELSVADGWELSKITVDPAQMEVSGAESVINSIVTLKTVPFTVQTGQRLFNSTLRLIVPEGVNVPYNEVTVSAEVIRKPIMRDQPSN
ncbi:MAG: hypothetical protein SR1Q5_01450 [Quinella sp. 1Q5]|nr:hypothetical protein [Quinella sp. 1Q5]